MSKPSKDNTNIIKRTTNNDAVTKGDENTNKMNDLTKNKKCECSPYKTFNWRG